MNIALKQSDIEKAIALYVKSLGIQSPIEEIVFTTTRKGGTSIAAEIELGSDAPVVGAVTNAVYTGSATAANTSSISDSVDSVPAVAEEAADAGPYNESSAEDVKPASALFG